MCDQNRKTISDAEAERIQALPSLNTLLPIVFANGSRVERLVMNCNKCDRDMEADKIQAEISYQSEIGISLNLYGVCYDCKLITPMQMRLRDDGTMLTCDPAGNWLEGRYAAVKATGVWPVLKSILSKLVIK